VAREGSVAVKEWTGKLLGSAEVRGKIETDTGIVFDMMGRDLLTGEWCENPALAGPLWDGEIEFDDPEIEKLKRPRTAPMAVPRPSRASKPQRKRARKGASGAKESTLILAKLNADSSDAEIDAVVDALLGRPEDID
jgi:hypothetical protein